MLTRITKDEQYENALEKAYALMQTDIKPESKESDDLEMLVDLIKEYELVHHLI